MRTFIHQKYHIIYPRLGVLQNAAMSKDGVCACFGWCCCTTAQMARHTRTYKFIWCLSPTGLPPGAPHASSESDCTVCSTKNFIKHNYIKLEHYYIQSLTPCMGCPSLPNVRLASTASCRSRSFASIFSKRSKILSSICCMKRRIWAPNRVSISAMCA